MTSWTYDGLDRAIEETNELALTRSFQYDAVGNLTSKTDRSGRETDYVYDNLYRHTQEKWIDDDPPAPSIDVTTNNDGSTTDEVQTIGYTSYFIQGGTFTITFDGQTTGSIAYNASAAAVQSALEGLSNIGAGDVSVVKTQNSSTTQLWQVTFQGALADTNVPQTTVDTTNIQSIPPRTDQEITNTQGGAPEEDEEQVVDLNDATGGTFTLSFGGQTTAALDWDAAAAEIDSALEALTSIDTVSVSGAAGGPWTITFTGSHSGQNVAELTGDASNLINRIVERTLLFTYDAADQLTAAEDPSAEYAYVYDNLGRVTQQTQTIAGLTPTIVFNQAFDAASNRTELTATIGSNADFKNTYTYDNLNRMTQVVQQGNGGNAVAAKRIDLTYNASGQFTQIDRYQSTGTNNDVAQTFFTYDGMGRLDTLEHKQDTTVLAGYEYGYDAASRITSIDSTVEGLSEFTYDVTNQLTAADHTSQPDESYSFDLNGNRTMTGHTVIANNRLSTDGTYDYEYDNEGNQTKRTKISDGSYEENTWDHRNRLTKVTFKNSGGTVLKTVEFAYDVFNRWTRRTVDADGPGGNDPTDTFFAYDGYEPVLQFDGTEDTDLSHRNLFGPAVDQILAVEDVTSLTSAGNPLWALSDHLGTPRDVADLNEGSGVTTVTNHRTYNSFGTQISETSAVDFIFGETGKMLEEHTGANWHIHRWTRDGRWLSQDPIGFAGGDTNLSRLVHNNPVNFVDPDGLKGDKPLSFWGKVGAFFDGLAGPRIKVSEVDEALSNITLGDILNPGIPVDQAHTLLGPSTKVEDLAKEEANGELYRKFGQAAGECAMAELSGGLVPRGVPKGTGPKFKLPPKRPGIEPFDGTVAARPKKKLPKDAPTGKPVDKGVKPVEAEAPKAGKPQPENPKPSPPEAGVPEQPKPNAPDAPTAEHGGKYGHIEDPPTVNSGKDFTQAQKKKVLEENRNRNNGQLRDDRTGQVGEPATQSKKGVTPSPSEVNVDHVYPKCEGGPNSFANAEVRLRENNLKKGPKIEEK